MMNGTSAHNGCQVDNVDTSEGECHI
jgi:hypothetical protein